MNERAKQRAEQINLQREGSGKLLRCAEDEQQTPNGFRKKAARTVWPAPIPVP
jgi:hypothetical protein